MQHHLMLLALEIANERAREADAHRLARLAPGDSRSRLRRLIERLAGNVRTATVAPAAPARRRPA